MRRAVPRGGAVLLALLIAAVSAPAAPAAPAVKLVRYHDIVLRVPASWPVYRLAGEPHRCIRFDRHAVYLGTPGASQRCLSRAAGRTEALVVFAFRLPATDRDLIHRAAGPAKATKFVHAAALAAANGDTGAFEGLTSQAKANLK